MNQVKLILFLQLLILFYVVERGSTDWIGSVVGYAVETSFN